MLTAEQIEAMKDRDEICELANKLAEDMAPSQFELDRRALLRDREEIVKRLRCVKYAETWSQLERLLDELLADLEGTK